MFDGGTGDLVSINREASRLVQSLCDPGQSAEQLLGVITCRRGDGREIALDRLPLAGALSGAETVRAEEIELSVPDGRRVTTLINATPIHGEDGAVASVVVTMQDLAPLQALERMRAEFLGMVSHELRVPLTSIKGSTAAALGAARLVAAAETREFFRIIDDQADRMIGLIADLLDAGRIEAGTLSVAPEPSEVAALVEQARGTFISGGGRHAVGSDLPPDLPPVLADRQRIVQVLNNCSPTPRATPRTPPPSGSRRPATGSTSRSRFPMRAGASRRSTSGSCSASTPAAGTARAGSAAGWAWPSARAWSRPMADASGPRAGAWASALASPSRSRWPGRPTPALDAPPGAARRRTRCPSSWSTTTRARCAMFATRWRRRATRPWSPATRGAVAHPPDREAPAGAARLDAARDRRDPTDADRAGTRRPARHLHLGLRARRDHRAGAGGRRRRLHRQALFADRAHGTDPGGPAPAGGARAVRARGPGHRLRPAGGSPWPGAGWS